MNGVECNGVYWIDCIAYSMTFECISFAICCDEGKGGGGEIKVDLNRMSLQNEIKKII